MIFEAVIHKKHWRKNMKTTTKMADLLERQKTLDALISDIHHSDSELEAQKYKKTFWDVARGFAPKNALSAGHDGSGGFLVPDEFENILVKGLENANVLRRLGRTIQTKHERKIPVATSHGTAGWAEELEPIVDSDESFGQVTLSAYKVGTQMVVSDELLEDSGMDLERYIAEEFAIRIGQAEEEAFVSGDGNGKPRGILYDAEIGAVTNEAVISIDDVIDLYHSLGERYREKAVWVMSDETFRSIYKVKTAQGINIWQPSLQNDVPTKLFGHNVEICESMPAPIAGSKPILFGDFDYYLIADRQNRSLKRLNELYAASGQVGFLLTQRVDAKLILPESVKCLQVKE